jgi:SAM-dependent methyltransferase
MTRWRFFSGLGGLFFENPVLFMTTSYSQRFQEPEAVAAYETKEYGVESYSTRIWQMQRPVVEKVLADFKTKHSGPLQLLDFACGTGRVLSCVESFADTADGIDISEPMVSVARTKCRRARLQVGDILANPELLGKYDIVTCFRLLLNLEPELRLRILRELRKVIRTPDGLLLANVHGNTHSLRHPAIVWRRRQGRQPDTQSAQPDVMANEMSVAEAEALFWESGFRVIQKTGFGILPPGFYKTPLRNAAVAVDRFLAGKAGWNNWSVDILFVCRPR